MNTNNKNTGHNHKAYTREMVERYLLEQTGGTIKLTNDTPKMLSYKQPFVVVNTKLNEARTTTINNMNMCLFDKRKGVTSFGFKDGDKFHITKKISDYDEFERDGGIHRRKCVWTKKQIDSMLDDDHICVEYNGYTGVSYMYCKKTGRFHSFVAEGCIRDDASHHPDTRTFKCPNCSPVRVRSNSKSGIPVKDPKKIDELVEILLKSHPELVDPVVDTKPVEQTLFDMKTFAPNVAARKRSDPQAGLFLELSRFFMDLARTADSDDLRRTYAELVRDFATLYRNRLAG